MKISKKIWILLLVIAAGATVAIYLRYFRKEYKEYTFKSDARNFTIKLKYNTDFTLIPGIKSAISLYTMRTVSIPQMAEILFLMMKVHMRNIKMISLTC